MSQDESLRLVAEVKDRFTGPLGALKKQLADLVTVGAGHNDTLEKSFGKVTGGVRAAEQAVASGLNPGLKALGVTSLGATAAIVGIGAALRNFASGASSIGQLSRDTTISAQQLREVQGVLGKVGVDATTSGQALQQFAENARLARNGIGPIIEFLTRQGRSPEGRAYFQNLARDIRNSKDAGEALDKALKGMEGIKDPVERRLYAENVLRMGDAARLVGGPLGTLQQQIEKFRATNGVLSDKDIESAERYQRALGDIGSSMGKLGTVIAIELAGPAEKVASAFAAIVSNERGGAILAIREGLKGIKDELGAIDWAEAGKDGLTFLREGANLATSLAHALHQAAEAIRSMREGKKIEALRHLDGASGPLARRLAPMPGDDIIDRNEQADALRGKIGTAQEQGVLQAELLKELQERGDKEGAKRLTEAMEANTKHLKSLEDALGKLTAQGGATVQQQSFDGTGFGGGLGGLIQRASLSGGYGGGGRAGGGGTLGERLFVHPTGANALGDPYRERRMQALRNDPSAEWRMRIGLGERGVPLPGSGGAGAVGRALRGGGHAFGGRLDLRDADPQVVAYIREQAAQRGIDPDTALAVSDGEGLRNFRPDKPVVGDGGTSHGPFQMHYAGGRGGNRQPGLGDDFTRATGLDARDPSTWKRQIEFSLDHAAKHGWQAWYGRAHHGVGVWDGIGGRAGYAGGGRQTPGDVAPVDGVGGVDQRQAGARFRRQAITDELRDQLARAGRDAGVNAEIYSGGQDESGPGHHGSHRHDFGHSADLKLYEADASGRRRYLSMNNEADRARMAAFIRGTVRYGATGVGAGPGYMGESGIHIGGGEPNAWGAGGSSANAPDWVRRAHREGMADQAAGLGRRREQEKPVAGFDAGAFSAAFKRRQRDEDARRADLKLSDGSHGALRAGAGAGQKVEADGRVHINVMTRDAGTQVRSSASGNLFREIVHKRGRQMQAAGEDA